MEPALSSSTAQTVFVLSTDHGTHPADKWAEMISQLVFPISNEIAEHKVAAATSAQLQIAQTLTDYVGNILIHEQLCLQCFPDEMSVDGSYYVDDALELIYCITDKTEWAKYMHENEELVRIELTRQFKSMQNVERLYHAEHTG